MYCAICHHPKIDAINAALDTGRAPNLVRFQFRLAPQSLAVHVAHRLADGQGSGPTSGLLNPRKALLDQTLRVSGIVGQGAAPTDDPMRRVRYHASALAAAWHEVDQEQRTADRLLVILQDAFAEQEMDL